MDASRQTRRTLAAFVLVILAFGSLLGGAFFAVSRPAASLRWWAGSLGGFAAYLLLSRAALRVWHSELDDLWRDDSLLLRFGGKRKGTGATGRAAGG